MKLWTLLENTSCRSDVTCEHGLSLYIETGEHRILFDMGQSAAFAANAHTLGIDLAQVDIAILSHGHYDHGGGLMTFMNLNNHAPIYMSCHAFGEHYHGTDRYIGLAPEIRGSDRIRMVGEHLSLDDQLELFSCNEKDPITAVKAYGLTIRQCDTFVPDSFLHEQYLLIHEGTRSILISGCSHKGILNVVDWFHPDVLVGGFHFKDISDPAILRDAAQTLLKYSTEYFTGHCTGEIQYTVLKEVMGDRLHALSTGKFIEL